MFFGDLSRASRRRLIPYTILSAYGAKSLNRKFSQKVFVWPFFCYVDTMFPSEFPVAPTS